MGSEALGTRCEVKNLNSLRSLVRAIEYEAERQADIIASGGSITQETRHWDENASRTHSLRSKEEAYDYRYFPEPDLVPVVPDATLLEAARETVGMMPAARRQRLAGLTGSEPISDPVQTVITLDLDELVVAAAALGADASLALTRAANDVAAKSDAAGTLEPSAFATLVRLESSRTLSATQSKTVLSELIDSGGGGDPEEIARRLGFEALPTSELDVLVDDVIASHPGEWARYLEGDPKVGQFLLGQVMRAAKGRANGKLVAEAFEARRDR